MEAHPHLGRSSGPPPMNILALYFRTFPLPRAKLIIDRLSSLAPLLYRRGSTNILPPPPLTSAIL
jgi:hypothetical protein